MLYIRRVVFKNQSFEEINDRVFFQLIFQFPGTAILIFTWLVLSNPISNPSLKKIELL